MTMTDLTPSRLRELLAAATPGDWKPVHATKNCGPYVTAAHWQGDVCDLYVSENGAIFIHNEEYAAANVELLAASKALAARVLEQDAELERLRGANSKAYALLENATVKVAGCMLLAGDSEIDRTKLRVRAEVALDAINGARDALKGDE